MRFERAKLVRRGGELHAEQREQLEDMVEDIERVLGSPEADTLIGNAANNVLFGFEGDDHIEGRDGDDVLRGSGGIDFLDGGTDECLGGETALNCEP